MNKQTEIIKQRFREQELLGKETFTINEINRILIEVDSLIENKNNTIKEIKETPEQFFKSVMDRITEIRTSTKYPSWKYHMIGDEVYIEEDTKTNDFYLRHSDFWAVFGTKFNLNFQEIKDLTKVLLEEHFKCNVNTTLAAFRSRRPVLEEHFKCNVKS